MPLPMPAARPVLRLVVSRPPERPLVWPSAELAVAVAETCAAVLEAEHARLGSFPSVEDVMNYLVDVRGFNERESVEHMAAVALGILGRRRAAAIDAHRRPKLPRRRPSRHARPVQLWLPFPEFQRAAA